MTVSYDDALKIVGDDDLVKESVLKNLAGDLYAKSGHRLYPEPLPPPPALKRQRLAPLKPGCHCANSRATLVRWGRASAARRSAIRNLTSFRVPQHAPGRGCNSVTLYLEYQTDVTLSPTNMRSMSTAIGGPPRLRIRQLGGGMGIGSEGTGSGVARASIAATKSGTRGVSAS